MIYRGSKVSTISYEYDIFVLWMAIAAKKKTLSLNTLKYKITLGHLMYTKIAISTKFQDKIVNYYSKIS